MTTVSGPDPARLMCDIPGEELDERLVVQAVACIAQVSEQTALLVRSSSSTGQKDRLRRGQSAIAHMHGQGKTSAGEARKREETIVVVAGGANNTCKKTESKLLIVSETRTHAACFAHARG